MKVKASDTISNSYLFSVRTRTALTRNGIKTFGDLYSLNKPELLRSRNVERKALDEIEDVRKKIEIEYEDENDKTLIARFTPYNNITSQLNTAYNEIERMTSGNYMHNSASAKMLIKQAEKGIDALVNKYVEKLELTIRQYLDVEPRGITDEYPDFLDDIMDVIKRVKI